MKVTKTYNFKEIEDLVQKFWKQAKLTTNAKPSDFKILMPPPNVTGSLHLGHALNNFLQDTLVRFARLQGKTTTWIPGFDHAGIATEIVVKKWIKANNWKINTQTDWNDYLTRWVKQQKTQITHQWDKFGLLINQEQLAYTFSPTFQEIVKSVFIQLYQQGLIYRAKRLVNFDLKLQTVLSDIEVVHKQVKGKLYYVKYWNAHKTATITVATTRPETIFADQALLMHPRDPKAKVWTKTPVINPLTNQLMPVLTSDQVDPQFGTGVLKCTPGHDFTDFGIGQKLQLKNVTCFNEKGILNKLAKQFAGQDRLVARKAIVNQLIKQKQLEKVVDIEHQLPYSSKSDTLLEPILSDQWFLKTQQWAKELLKIKKQIVFVPHKYQTQFENWLNNCQDWCISRQLSWGHRMPIYFHENGDIVVAENKPDGKGWKQSNDVLDTWFSSALWSLVNNNWKIDTPIDKKRTSLFSYLVTSYDIIFFWVTKMLFFHYHFRQEVPFKKILIHGLVRTENNEKMSKSKGNTLDPLTLIEEFGVDSLRLYLLGDHKIGEDLKFNQHKLVQASQFCNKLWNINRLVTTYQTKESAFDINNCHNGLNHYIYQKFSQLSSLYQNNFLQHRWSLIIKEVIEFVWKDFSNLYLELAKIELKENEGVNNQEIKQTITFIWKQILLLLQPFTPFISEAMWLTNAENKTTSILNSHLHLKTAPVIDNDESKLVKTFLTIVEEMQSFINPNQDKLLAVSMATPEATFYQCHQQQLNNWLKKRKMTLKIIKQNPAQQISVADKSVILKNLKQRIAFVQAELKRSRSILNNKNFLIKASKIVVDQEKTKAENWEKELTNLVAKEKTINQ